MEIAENQLPKEEGLFRLDAIQEPISYLNLYTMTVVSKYVMTLKMKNQR